jgi:hypothetical protein
VNINRRGRAAARAVVSAGWMVTVPPLGRYNSRFVDGSHPYGFLTACTRDLGTDKRPTGYEVMQ